LQQDKTQCHNDEFQYAIAHYNLQIVIY